MADRFPSLDDFDAGMVFPSKPKSHSLANAQQARQSHRAKPLSTTQVTTLPTSSPVKEQP